MAIIGVSLARNADTALRVVIGFACQAGLVTGDLVYQSSVDDKSVIKVPDNTLVAQTIGVCLEKPTTTTCKILVLGVVDGQTGLTKGGRIFLSTTGTLTTTKPATGYLHNLGVAVSATEALFIPNNVRLLQV